MKFIHCADLHLDAVMNSGLPPDKAKERRGELLSAFSRLAQTADDCGAAAVIIAGDLFDRKAVTVRTKKYVIETIAEHPGIDFLILPGNHDAQTFSGIETLPSNLKLLGKDWVSYEYGNVTVTGASECNPETLETDPARLNIVVLHGADGKEFRLRDLENRNIDYLALGHYHEYGIRKLDRRGVYCYSGCLEGRGFDECGIKGYVLLETDNTAITPSFIPCSNRLVSVVDVDFSDCDSLAEQRRKASAALEGVDRRGIVRLNITGSYPLGCEKLFSVIASEYEDEFYHFELTDSSVLRINPEDYIHDISLKGEFIRLCMSEIKDEVERSRVISCGIRALRGEEPE